MDADAPAAERARAARLTPLHEPRDDRQRGAFDVAVAVAEAASLPVDGAGIWRAGSAVLVGLPEVPALVRVDEPARADDAHRQVRVAAVLRDRAVPAIRSVGPDEQPVVTAAGPVTLWAWEPPVGRPVPARELGRVARLLHDRTRDLDAEARSTLPTHEPLAAVRAELDRATSAGCTAPDDLDRLDDVIDRLASAWPAPGTDPLGDAVVHGDLHRGNVVPAWSGPVLADLELAGWGPASADLAPGLVAVRRYGAAPATFEEQLTGYGATVDPRTWAGLEVLVEAYELWVTAWAVANRTVSERAEHEAEVRLERWRTGTSPPWTLR